MEHVSKSFLLVITLLQLCRAELTSTWYSANVINDGDFSPKPISEIFSTEPPSFSSTNPIVVLSQSTIASTPISTSVPPGSSSSFSTPSMTPELISTYSTTPSTLQTLSSFMPSSSSQQPFSQSTIPDKPIFDLGQPFPFPFKQDKENTNSQNYFMIYQQSQNLPPTAPQQTFSTFKPSSFGPSSTPRPEISTPLSTFSTFSPEMWTSPSTFSTFSPAVSSWPSSQPTFQPEVSSISTTLSTVGSTQSTMIFTPSSESTFPPTFPSSAQPSSPTPTPPSNTIRTTRAIVPCNTTAGTLGTKERFPTLRIRMIAPSGSITNVNINPIVSTTTKRPTTRRTTTTRRPTTTRTRRTKKNRNTFDGCVNTCEGRGRSPICASPLAQTPIDPNKLKGFPSVCHMACHNSFKRDQYEMLVDGRCGKLRTRIRTVDSDKLKRVELNKAQYTVVDGPQTVLEFSSLPR